MSRRFIGFFSLVALFLSNSASGQTVVDGCIPSVERKTTNVYFSNGILVDDTKANIAVSALDDAYKSSLEARYTDQTYEFKSAFNPTIDTYSDILEVLTQKMQEEGIANEGLSPAQFLALLQGGLNLEEVRHAIALTVGVSTRVPTLITEALLERLGTAMGTAQAQALAGSRAVPSTHVNYYVSDLQAGKRVFVIAHSQGNLFTNIALTGAAASLPNAASSLAMIGIATPATRQFRNSFYRTADDDRVIQALRAIETVLGANIDNDPGIFNDFRSLSNHYFLTDYFDGRLLSRGQINDEVFRLAGSVPFPTLRAGQGAIRATLTWDSQPDVDLHAYEPNGAHIYYSNKVGSSGELDVDDVSAFGPENYFVPCAQVQPGTYRIGVNYYAGSAPSVATVSLFLGDGRTPSPKTITLASARGQSGNNSPVTVFTVGVAIDADGKPSYTVQ